MVDDAQKLEFRELKCNIVEFYKNKAPKNIKGLKVLRPLQSKEEFNKMLSVVNWGVTPTSDSNLIIVDADTKDYNSKLNKLFTRTRRSFKHGEFIVSKHGFIRVIDAIHDECVKFTDKFHDAGNVELFAENQNVIVSGTYNSKKESELEEGESMSISTWTNKDDTVKTAILTFTKQELNELFSGVTKSPNTTQANTDAPLTDNFLKEDIEKLESDYDLEILLRGGFKRGSRRKSLNSLYCKFRVRKWSIKQCSEKVRKVNKTLTEPLDDKELEQNLVYSEDYYQNTIFPSIEIKITHNEAKAIEDEAIKIEQLNDITDPKYADKLVKVKVVIASNFIPYSVPHKINAQCTSDDEKHTLHDNENIPANKIITLDEKDLPEFVDKSTAKKQMDLQKIAKNYFHPTCKVSSTVEKSTTINRLKIRPIMHNLVNDGEDFLDEEGNSYSSYDVYIIQKDITRNLTAGKEIEITGIVMADPKTSKITLMVISLKELDENKFNLEKIKEIQEYHKSKNTAQILQWNIEEFSKYSKTVKRENVFVGTILNMFSSLGFKFEYETVRGWVNTTIIGDSTTAKSKTVKSALKLYKAGQIASGEMASMAGIAGATTQIAGGQWVIDFGLLPLQDMKALWLDGAHKLPKDEMDRLAEAERNGKIEINKAAKGQAMARTRQGRIMNPLDDDKRDTITMNNFIYPVQALNNMFQLQSIARIDVAIFVSDDVASKYRNVKMTAKHNPLLENYTDLIKLIWSNQCKVRFDDDIIDEILNGATLLENLFKTDEIPLITNDQKYKLAKLSASIAGFTTSFNDDYTEIIVKKEHIQYVVDFITTEYTKIGLAAIKKQGTFGDININTLLEIIEKVSGKIEVSEYEVGVSIIKWIGLHRKFTKEDLMDEFTLSRDSQVGPLISYLVNENMIKRKKTGFGISKKGIAFTKFIINSDENICQELQDEHDSLYKSFKCDSCNVSNANWTHTKQTAEQIQETHQCLYDGKIVVIFDD